MAGSDMTGMERQDQREKQVPERLEKQRMLLERHHKTLGELDEAITALEAAMVSVLRDACQPEKRPDEGPRNPTETAVLRDPSGHRRDLIFQAPEPGPLVATAAVIAERTQGIEHATTCVREMMVRLADIRQRLEA